ncbi:hypothetical protein BLA29_007174 [Euroglyphus maynei]|uniref:Uncharacterized protein n=1 Tax=Euroglyphus maynei TaxID=6958 RepID=A0A1Y3AW31_EURMA|nr:hypothetical protein BLA29_007174 [Euroglyphus maynei]
MSSEPLEMSQARNVYTREREHFRRELLNTLRQYESRPISFEIKQHLRMNGWDLKPKCLERYRRDTEMIACNQLPIIGNSLRIRSMCNSELPHTSRNRSSTFRTARMIRDDEYDNDDCMDFRSSYTSSLRQALPRNKLTYESTRRATTNSHVLSFERQLIDEMDKMIDSIDHISDNNRQEWLQPLKTDRQRQYFHSLYDDVGYSLPLYNRSDLLMKSSSSTNNDYHWKFEHDKDDDHKTEVERFYDKYLSQSKYVNHHKLDDDSSNYEKIDKNNKH